MADRTSIPEPEAEPDLITVAIPARNEERSIARCLQSVLAQTVRDLQVIVVDGASGDGTAQIVGRLSEQDARIEEITNPTGTIPSSLNVALSAARGRWFVRVDAHSVIPKDYVAIAVNHLRTGRWGGVGGRKDGVGNSAAGVAIAAAMRSRFGVGNSVYHYGESARTVDHIPFGAYPTSLLRELGGWDERLLANEDFELDQRLIQSGRQLLFDPSLVIAWECRQTIPDLFRQYRRYGRAKFAVARLHPESIRARHLAPPLLVVLLVLAAALGRRRPQLAALAAGPYLMFLAAGSLTVGRRVSGSTSKAWVPAALLAMHMGWGIGFWEGALSAGGQPSRSPSA